MLEDQRARFSLPQGLHYLNCASRGPLPKVAEAAGRAAFARQIVPRAAPPEEYFRGAESLRSNIGRLVGCSPERVAITPAVSYGIGIAAHNWPVRKGSAVVVPEEEFPSDVYAWIAACQRGGGMLRTVARPSSDADRAARWSEAIVDAIDRDTSVVNLSTVHWTDGLCFDVAAIAARAREVGALVVVDATQSLGAMRFAYDDVAPDLLLCSAYKWLFGPYQIGFAVVGDRLLEGEPFEYHWSNRAGSQEVSGTGYRHEFRHGARRFDVGEHANDITVSMLDASIGQVLEWGTDAVQDYCRRLLEPLDEYIATSPYRGARGSERAAHIVGLRAAAPGLLERAAHTMAARDIRISLRGDALRISPHVYNTAHDIGALIEALKDASDG